MRVTGNFEQDVVSGINSSEESLQISLEEVSTGKAVNEASDNPAASSQMVSNTLESDLNDQYTTNANTALGAAQTADSALSSVTSLLSQAISLGTQGANGTESSSNQAAIASQVEGILQSVVSDANTTYEGVSVFGGTSGASVAFTVDSTSSTGYTYQGNSGTNSVQIGSSLSVQSNIPGDQIFTSSQGNVLGSLSQLVTALQSGNQSSISSATSAVSTALNYVSQQHAVYGNTISQIDSQETYLSSEKVTLSTQQTNLVDVDTATAAEELATDEAQNTAVMEAAAKVLPTSLLTYLQ